jgi:DNA-binding MarR family transcriptional regulator
MGQVPLHRNMPMRMGPGFAELAPQGNAVSVEVVMNLLRAARLVTDRLESVFHAHRLTAATFSVLDVLGNDPSPLTPKEISIRTVAPAQTLTSLLDGLEANRLVSRRPNPDDRRSTLVVLTPTGRRVLLETARELITRETELLSAMPSAQQDRLVVLLGTVQRATSSTA